MTAVNVVVLALVVAGAIAFPIVVVMRRRATDRAQYSRWTLLLSGGIQLLLSVVFFASLAGESGAMLYFHLAIGIALLISGVLVIRGVIRRARNGGEIKWHGY